MGHPSASISDEDDFVQERHKPPTALERPRELIVACPPMRSNVNLSRIARAAGCCGVRRMICCGNAKVIGKIARDAGEALEIEIHRTLPPVLKQLREEGYQIVGLEQTTNATSIFEFAFQRQTVLVVGNERSGIEDEVLRLLDHAVEIPVYGLPYAHNAATATAMALYEYLPAVSPRLKPKGRAADSSHVGGGRFISHHGGADILVCREQRHALGRQECLPHRTSCCRIAPLPLPPGADRLVWFGTIRAMSV